MKKIGHYLGNIAGAVLAFALYMLLEIAYFAPKRINLGSGDLRVFATSLMTVVILFVIFYLYRQQLKEENQWGFNESPHWDARRLGIAVIGFILIMIGSVVMLNLVGGGVSENQQSLNRLEQGNAGLFKILVVFIAPFCEETIFRGMLSKYILVYWVLGIVLAWVYTTTKDLRYSMLVHMCYNAMGLI